MNRRGTVRVDPDLLRTAFEERQARSGPVLGLGRLASQADFVEECIETARAQLMNLEEHAAKQGKPLSRRRLEAMGYRSHGAFVELQARYQARPVDQGHFAALAAEREAGELERDAAAQGERLGGELERRLRGGGGPEGGS